MKKSNWIYFIIFFIFLFTIFKNWLISPYIIGGDWPFFFQQSVNSFSYLPPIWNPMQSNGLGGISITYSIDSYLYFTGWFFSGLLHIPWPVVYKIFWFGLFLGFSIFSSISLFKTIFPKSQIWQQLLAAFLYTTNTYILLVVGGGQMGVALGYATAALVLKKFIDIFSSLEKKKRRFTIQYVLFAGLFFSLQILFDFRIAYITILAAILYLLINIRYQISRVNIANFINILFYMFIMPVGISLLLHAFWILPILLTKSDPASTLGSAYTSLSSVKYFSFATFENSFGLLHPYWPENIFGKVGFMKPEYLILPIIAFSSLFFITKKNKREAVVILFFTLTGLVGVFLAKGANDPFGEIYLWMFQHVPGFIMFRDPTKWYTLIAISYSILIPFTIGSFYEGLNAKVKNQKLLPTLFVIIFVLFWLFTIRQAVLNQLGGTFAKREVPSDYVLLKNKFVADNYFYRTLWVPKQQRFTFSSSKHPSIEANTFFSATDAASFQQKLSEKKTQNYLADLGIKYIVIPDDVYGEIFLDGRKYAQKQRNAYEKILNNITWMKRIQDNKITIYETKSQKDYFWLKNGNGRVSYIKVSPTEYKVFLKNVKRNDILVFSENYNTYWKGNIDSSTEQLLNNKFDNSINSFTLLKDGSYIVTISFSAEKYYTVGRYISFVSLLILLGILIILHKRNKAYFI